MMPWITIDGVIMLAAHTCLFLLINFFVLDSARKDINTFEDMCVWSYVVKLMLMMLDVMILVAHAWPCNFIYLFVLHVMICGMRCKLCGLCVWLC